MLLLATAVVPAGSLDADTLYQTTPEGRTQVIQRDAIVVRQDASVLVYKHFELHERRVVKVQLNHASLPYTVVPSSPRDHQRIVDLWKHFGYTATVTDTAGKSTHLFDAYIDYYPPGGRGSLLESVPAVTSLPLLLDSGGADVIDFSKLTQVQFDSGRITAMLSDGRVETGKYLMPTQQPAEVRFLGITDQYNPSSEDVFDFSQPLSRLKEIRFEQ